MTLVRPGARNLCKCVMSVYDAIGSRSTGEILPNHGEIKEQQRAWPWLGPGGKVAAAAFSAPGVFGAGRRLARCCCCCWVAVASSLQVQGQAARPCCCTPTPTRPAALFRAPSPRTSQKTGIFRKKISLARKYFFNLAFWVWRYWVLRSLGTFVSISQWVRFLDRRRKKCGLPEISPRVSPLPSKQNS